MFELKRLAEGSLSEALLQAKHYRDLNQPEEAESICRDILDVDSQHKEAKKTLGLALTDRFPDAWRNLFDEALAIFRSLPSEYEKTYYAGVAWERLAKAQLESDQTRNAAHALEHALTHFDEAMKLAPGTADPILRWNRCVRFIKEHGELAESLAAQESPTSDFGQYE